MYCKKHSIKQEGGVQERMKTEIKEEMEEIDDRIQCPHCGRKFNEAAATRHIQICKKKASMKK